LLRNLDSYQLLSEHAAATPLERADGNWQHLLDSICKPYLSSISDLAVEFADHVLPARQAVSTRTKNWRNWCAVLTWAVAHDALDQILPMSATVLMGATMEWLHLGCSPHLLYGLWCSISDRHHAFNLPSPLRGSLSLSKLKRCLAAVAGMPKRLKLPIQREHIHAILRLQPDTLRALRDHLITVFATVFCLRVSEVANLQICDAWYDFDAARGLAYLGTLALNILKRKNDQLRKGHQPRAGKALDPSRDIVYRLQRFHHYAGLRASANCNKRAAPAARCRHCPAMFPKTTRGGSAMSPEPCSRQLISEAIQHTLAEIGVDTHYFSGISARKGGLSTAVDAGVPEPILFLQSGHGQTCAARNYMQFQSVTHLFATWQAFQL
jgi:hypothetical protein